MTRPGLYFLLTLVGAFGTVSFAQDTPAAASPSWTLEQVKTVLGVQVPECVLVVPATKQIFVSNVATDNEGYWVDDQVGHITNLDGIEVLENGAFIVSDFTGNQVCLIEPDRKTAHVLAKLETPADIGIDRERNLLYVPQLTKNRVVVFNLKKQ